MNPDKLHTSSQTCTTLSCALFIPSIFEETCSRHRISLYYYYFLRFVAEPQNPPLHQQCLAEDPERGIREWTQPSTQCVTRMMGFSDKLINKALQELLKVYGGEGWVFIEEASYRVLIETILEKEKDQEQEAEDKGDCSQGNGSSDDNSTPVAGPQNEVVPASSSMQAVLDTTSRCNEVMESASMSNEVHDPSSLPNEPDASMRSPPFTVSSPLPMDGFPPRRRKPCYGWINSDEELDIVELTPAPLSENLRRILDRVDGLDMSKKHRSGWDARPQDK